MPNLELKPLKGAHLILNERMACFIAAAVDEIQEVFGYQEMDHNIDENLEEAMEMLSQVEDWHTVTDKFGTKVFKSMPYADANTPEQKGEFRVGVVKTRKGAFIDIRPWGTY